MDTAELEWLLLDLESDRVERKPSLAQAKEIRQTICAFANDLPDHRQPGVLFIGVQNDGGCAGLSVDDLFLRLLTDIQGEGQIQPMPTFSVQRHRLRDCEVAVVEVEPAAAPPVRFRGAVWVRIGPSTRTATAEQERSLSERRRGRDLPFDLRPVPGATLDDLDLEEFDRTYLRAAVAPEVLLENQRPREQQLSALRLTSPTPEAVPTVLGILVTGKDPRRFLPGAYVQFLRLAGTTLADPIKDQKELSGPLPELLIRIDELLELNVSVAVEFTSGTRDVARPDYPHVALQQIVRNAVLHRTYEGTYAPVRVNWFEDRVEIWSPGGPFGRISRATFGTPGLTDYRNPHLAEAMKYLGFVQRFGAGIPTAEAALARNGNPPLEFSIQQDFVLVTLRRVT